MATFEETRLPPGFDGDDTSVNAKPRKSRANKRTAEHAANVPASTTDTASPKSKTAAASKAVATKSDAVLKLLRSTKGVTVDAIMQATGWQAHSVRGYLSAVVKKKLALNLTSLVGKDGQRRYRISNAAEAN